MHTFHNTTRHCYTLKLSNLTTKSIFCRNLSRQLFRNKRANYFARRPCLFQGKNSLEKGVNMAVFQRIHTFFQHLIDPAQEEFMQYRTIAEFGYHFNHEGKLISIKDYSPFEFQHYGNRRRDQRRYEALGEVITQHVYDLLETECRLCKLCVPINVDFQNEAFSFIFVSPGAREQQNLLLLVHGSGAVRAGQWSRRLIINDCLDSGTQIPYIKRAMQEGYGVMVLNPNDNRIDGERLERRREKMRTELKYPQPLSMDGDSTARERRRHYNVKGNESPQQHLQHVWDNFVPADNGKKIFVVAHSAAGAAVVNLLNRQPTVLDRLSAVAFTASTHRIFGSNQTTTKWVEQNCVDWVPSSKPLDTVVSRNGNGCVQLSAGTDRHEITSFKACNSIFEYFNNKLRNPKYQPGGK